MIQYIEIKVIKGRDIIAHGIIVKMMYTICGIGIHPTVWLDLSSDTLWDLIKGCNVDQMESNSYITNAIRIHQTD